MASKLSDYLSEKSQNIEGNGMNKIFNCSQLPRSYESKKTAVYVLILCHYFPSVTLLQERKTYLDTYLFGSLSVVENLCE